jgi:hypothetical protein
MTSGPPLKHAPAARGAQREAKSLLWWVSLANVAVLAIALLLLAFSPVTVDTPIQAG